MRINQFLSLASGISRRAADEAIAAGRVLVNGAPARLGQPVAESDQIQLDTQVVTPQAHQYLLLHKPVGYVSSRRAQDSAPTIYELLPAELLHLKPAGRLDKDSAGLMLLTNDGALAQQLTHPRHAKLKRYRLKLDRPLEAADEAKLEDGVKLDDGDSRLKLENRTGGELEVSMHEGRNRQIRRTFSALGYTVTELTRTHMARLQLWPLAAGEYKLITKAEIL